MGCGSSTKVGIKSEVEEEEEPDFKAEQREIVVTWGDSDSGGDSSAVQGILSGRQQVKHIFSTCAAFAALMEGRVSRWR
jgi:hypothetical protein